MKPTNKEHKLTHVLRAGDPAAHIESMHPTETATMRARVRAASRVDAGRSWKPWALAAGAIATAALVVIAAPNGLFRADTRTTPAPAAGPGIEVSVATDRRTIHFIAPNGTRIIWSLRKDDERPRKADDPKVRS